MKYRQILLPTAAVLAAAALWLGAFLCLAPQSAAAQPIGILGDDGGRLVQYAPDGKTAVQYYEVYTFLLPENDRNRLLNGIKVYTAEELRTLTEDFGA